MTNRSSRYSTLKTFAAQHDLSYETVRRLVANGELPHIRIGKAYRIDLDALEASVLSVPVRVADRSRSPENPPPAVREAYAQYIEQVVAAAPPLTSDQVARISTLLGSACDASALAASA